MSCPEPRFCGYVNCGKRLPFREGRGRRADYCDEACKRSARTLREKLASLDEPDATPCRRSLAHQRRLLRARELAAQDAGGPVAHNGHPSG